MFPIHTLLLVIVLFVAGCTTTLKNVQKPSVQTSPINLPTCNPSKGLDLTNYELAFQASVEAGFENIKNAEASITGKYSTRLLAIRSYRSLYFDYHEFFDCNISLTDQDTDLLIAARDQITKYLTEVDSILKGKKENVSSLLEAARDTARSRVDTVDFSSIDNTLSQLPPPQRSSLKKNIGGIDIPLEVTSTQFSAGITIPDTIDAKACASSNEKIVQPLNGAGISSLDKLQKYYLQTLRSPEDGIPKSYKYVLKFEIGNIHQVALDIADNISNDMDYFECEDS